MLNTSDVKSLSKGGTTVSLEEISNSIDNKLSIDNLTGSNGIEIVKNAAGDRAEVKIGDKFNVPSNVQFQSTGAYVGFYADNGEFGLKAITSSGEQTAQPFIKGEYKADNTFNFTVQSPAGSSGVRITNTGITNWSASEGYTHNFLTEGNVKTINNQSIYGSGNINTTPTLKTINSQSILGSGNIDTTPALKTINSQSITGDGNIYMNEFKVTNSDELNFKATESLSDLYIGYRTLSESGGGQTNYTISSYKFMKGTGSTTAFADLYCAKLYTSSDERLKENIKPYEPTASVLDLSIKEFNYKDSKVKSVGVIAQEVQKLFPDAVSADKKSGYLSVDDRSLMYMLMAEVKKLRDRVNELEGK